MPSDSRQVADAYDRYGPALLRKAERILRNPIDAEDVVHSLFTDFLAKAPRSLELPFLYRAVGNRSLNRIRDQANRARLVSQHGFGDLHRSSCEGTAISLDLLAKLADRLDAKTLEALVCLFIDDMSQEDAAAFLGTSRRTIGKRLNKIRAAVGDLKATQEALA